jgi:hypothetical protein
MKWFRNHNAKVFLAIHDQRSFALRCKRSMMERGQQVMSDSMLFVVFGNSAIESCPLHGCCKLKVPPSFKWVSHGRVGQREGPDGLDPTMPSKGCQKVDSLNSQIGATHTALPLTTPRAQKKVRIAAKAGEPTPQLLARQVQKGCLPGNMGGVPHQRSMAAALGTHLKHFSEAMEHGDLVLHGHEGVGRVT